MNEEKREKPEAKGWKVTSVGEFLQLTPDEEAIIELRLDLSRAVVAHRSEYDAAGIRQTNQDEPIETR